MPFGLGPWELIIILVIVIIVFGVGKLPEVGGAVGKGIREFKKAQEEDETPDKAKTTAAKEPPKGDAGSGEVKS